MFEWVWAGAGAGRWADVGEGVCGSMGGCWVQARVWAGTHACIHVCVSHTTVTSPTPHTVFSANQFACISLHHLSAYLQSDESLVKAHSLTH